MKKEDINRVVIATLNDYCSNNRIEVSIDNQTSLIGGNRILDSMGLVSVIVDIETALLDEDLEISLTSEAAMSSRISPFRSVGALCNFIEKQLESKENE
jgi:acyl carrier protein